MKRESFEIDGKRYVTTKVMEGFWDVKANTIADYCRDGLVIGAFKDSSNRYMIPQEAKKPLSKNIIEKVLWLVIQLQQNPTYPIDYSSLEVKIEDMEWAFKYLTDLSFINPIAGDCSIDRIPYVAKLTSKGMELVQNQVAPKNKKKTLSVATIIELLPALVKIANYAIDLYEKIA